MRYTADHIRVQRIMEICQTSWQNAFQFAVNNDPLYDVLLDKLFEPCQNTIEGERMKPFFEPFFDFFTNPVPTKCICGHLDGSENLTFSGTYKQLDNPKIYVCPKCGVGRLPLVPSNHREFYLSGAYAMQYKDRFSDFDHEKEVAHLRLEQLKTAIPEINIMDCKALSVCSGIGAFGCILNEQGADATGLELYDQGKLYNYTLTRQVKYGDLLDIELDSYSYDLITFFDCMEHMIDPSAYIQRAASLLKCGGVLVIEVPDMGKTKFKVTNANRRHLRTKDFEHIWYFTEKGLSELVQRHGFVVRKVINPIVGKTTIYAQSIGHTLRVGTPPGVGDLYWCLLKMEDLKKRVNADRLEVYIQDSGDIPTRDFNRSATLTEAVSFVDSVQYANLSWGNVKEGVTSAVIIYDNLETRIDFLMVPNAIIDTGKHIDLWMPDYKANYNMQINVDPLPTKIKRKIGNQDPLIVISSLDQNNNQSWLNGFGALEWAWVVESIADTYKTKPVLIGGYWDTEYVDYWSSKIPEKKYTGISGQLTLKETLFLLKNADLVISVISGMSILANHFKTPTIALCPEHLYKTGFPYTWIIDQTYLKDKYHVINTQTYGKEMVSQILDVIDPMLEKKPKPKQLTSKKKIGGTSVGCTTRTKRPRG